MALTVPVRAGSPSWRFCHLSLNQAKGRQTRATSSPAGRVLANRRPRRRVVDVNCSGTANMDRKIAAFVSIASVAGAALVGGSYGPQRPREAVWYGSLRKPSFTPPGSAIGITWGVLETLLCVTGYRLLTRPSSDARTTALAGWVATLGGLAGFPAVFFGGKKLGASATVAAAMFAASSATAVTAARVDETASVAMMPLALWTAFAVLLSEELWRRN